MEWDVVGVEWDVVGVEWGVVGVEWDVVGVEWGVVGVEWGVKWGVVKVGYFQEFSRVPSHQSLRGRLHFLSKLQSELRERI